MAKCIVLTNGNSGGVVCTNATAIASHVLSGKTFGKGEEIVVGTMKNNGAVSVTIQRNGTYTIPIGYHNGNGVVRGATLPKQNGVTYVPGTGPITSNYTVMGLGNYMNGDITIKGDPNLVAQNIKQGVTLFGIPGSAVE